MSRGKKQESRLSVRCIVSDRWLSFLTKAETKLDAGEPINVAVMTRSKDNRPKKLCELYILREDLEDTLRMIY